MRNKQKEKVKIIFTSIHYRMISICLCVFFFIVVMVAALGVELYENQESYIGMYEEQQAMFVEQLGTVFTNMYACEKTDDDVIRYLSKNVKASGSRFFVLSKNQEVLFAKNDITTKTLGTNKDKNKFFERIKKQDVTIQKFLFEVENDSYEIAVISDIYSIKTDGNLIKHMYYILLAVAIMSLVLISLLMTLIGSWNRTQRKLEGTRKELDIRNEKMEQISQETGIIGSEKTDMQGSLGETGIIQSEKTEFYNVYTIRMLLQKSEDVHLKPLQMIFLTMKMEDRYFGKDEIFGVMSKIQKTLSKVEVMGEIRKGKFVILAYKTTAEEAKKRLKDIQNICEKIEKEKGITIQCELSEEDGKTAIERFETMK